MEFPGVFVPGSNDYYAPRLKNPASYLLGPSKAKQDDRTNSIGRASGPASAWAAGWT